MNLKTCPIREDVLPKTGIYVFAISAFTGERDAFDISALDADSLTQFLMRDGGSNPLAENVVRVLLGHPQKH